MNLLTTGLSSTGYVALVVFIVAGCALAITVVLFLKYKRNRQENHDTFQIQRSRKKRLTGINYYLYILIFFIEVVLFLLGIGFFIGDLM